jgi:hypothetical protein
MAHPAADAAGKGCQDCSRGDRAPGHARAGELVDIEPRRHRFFGDCTVTVADDFGECAPFGDPRRVVGMGDKPRFHGAFAVGRKHAVDIGMQFVGGHG